MPDLTIEELRQFLAPLQGRETTLDSIRRELRLDPEGNPWEGIRNMMFRLTEQRLVKPSGKRDGVYRVIPQINAVKVFGTNHNNEIFNLMFPKDRDTDMEFGFAEKAIVRAGDLILIAGVSNYGKTAVAMNFLAENIDTSPVLLGNEFTTSTGEPTPRFINRLRSMDWVEWVSGTGDDKFTLLPVMTDFPEYVVKDRLNIIDWINIETGEHYQIGQILNEIKRAVGEGVVVAVIQKSEQASAGRGGQFTKDFADLELLIDRHTELESRLTIGKCKESSGVLTGRSWAFGIFQGVKLTNIREVRKCKSCYGKGFTHKGECDNCNGIGYVDK